MYLATINGTDNFSFQSIDQGIIVNDLQHQPEISRIDESTYLVILDKKPYYVSVLKKGKDHRDFEFLINNKPISVRIRHSSEQASNNKSLPHSRPLVENIKAPMPGLIVDVLVHDGEEVIDGQPLLILKAMKMENIIRAPHDGIVKHVSVKKEQKINKDDTLIQF